MLHERHSVETVSYHVAQCQQGRSSPPHRRGCHTGSADSAEHWDKRENKLDHRDHTPAHSHTAELQGGMQTESELQSQNTANKSYRKTVRQELTCMCLRFGVWQRAVCTTYDRAPGTSNGCRPLGGYTPQHRQQWLCRDTHSPHLSHILSTDKHQNNTITINNTHHLQYSCDNKSLKKKKQKERNKVRNKWWIENKCCYCLSASYGKTFPGS